MRYKLSILFLLLTSMLFAQQNLVPNPSFENYSSCPNNEAQLDSATGWINPNCGTSDYYNACSFLMNVPGTWGDRFQYAHTGVAYAGFYAYSKPCPNGREYVQIQLNSPLISSNCYFVTFYLNNANWANYAVNKLGCYFSNNPVSCSSSSYLLNYMPQIYTENIIADTMNWIAIKGIFVANGGEQYITIGNFFNDASIDTLLAFPTQLPNEQTYYLVDDVSVISIDSINIPAFAGNDTSITLGDSAFIGQDIINLNCNWYVTGNLIASNISGFYVKPSTTTTYVVEQNLCGQITYDTVTIKINFVGINAHEEINNYIKVFPNPAINNLTVNWTMTYKNIFEIFDLTGAKRMSVVLENSSSSILINLSNLDNGLYYYIIRDNNGNNIKTDKFIIQK